MSELSLRQANQIIEKAIEAARAKKLKPLTVAVLDGSGHLVALQREDGASMFRNEVAQGKAWAAVAMGVAARKLNKTAQTNPAFFNALSATSGGKFIPQTGGVLIKDAAGKIIGAAGASGDTGDEDEAACIAGITGAGLHTDPVE